MHRDLEFDIKNVFEKSIDLKGTCGLNTVLLQLRLVILYTVCHGPAFTNVHVLRVVSLIMHYVALDNRHFLNRYFST